MLCTQIWMHKSFLLGACMCRSVEIKSCFYTTKALLPAASITIFRESSNYHRDGEKKKKLLLSEDKELQRCLILGRKK